MSDSLSLDTAELTDDPEESGPARRVRVVTAFLCGALPALIAAYLCGALSSGGSSRSILSVTLNARLIELTAAAVPVALAVVAVLLRLARMAPLALTWGYGLVAGLSWLGLLFMAQVKHLVPHVTPLVTVQMVVGAAFAAGAALTDRATTGVGRFAALIAVLASHAGIVAIVASIIFG
jgi:hypothetical protein